jgi:hypothetical protein
VRNVDDKQRARKFCAVLLCWRLIAGLQLSYVLINTVAVDVRQMPKERDAINGCFVLGRRVYHGGGLQ